ncbi:MAG TPA: pyridoxal-phosphate dependent enzyme [Candidatus Paceibacterota bacterium]|nr:pyridoxal-phosphate dependent enzyme [Candidatus Paceibacterota bacterium]
MRHTLPHFQQLVRLGEPLSRRINIFANKRDRVDIVPAFLFGDTFNSKAPVAYELLREGVMSGAITPNTTVVCASSGNTGLNVALHCAAMNLKCEIVMQTDTPPSKVGLISALGRRIKVELVNSGTVQYARERGKLRGFYDTDQYGRRANRIAQGTYMAPQLFAASARLNETYGAQTNIDIIVAPGGTLGTAGGLLDFVQKGYPTTVVPALCADGEEVPGARDPARIKRDVTIGSLDEFTYWRQAGRYDSFLASYAMFHDVGYTPGGPTSGLALCVALRFIAEHKRAGTLDQFRGPNGRIQVVFLCPDDFRAYVDLYRSVLNAERDFRPAFIPGERLLEAA